MPRQKGDKKVIPSLPSSSSKIKETASQCTKKTQADIDDNPSFKEFKKLENVSLTDRERLP